MQLNFKKALALALSAAMVLTAAPMAGINANAAAKVKLSATKGTITVGKTKKVTIKNTKKSNIKKVTFKYSKSGIVKAKRSGLTIKFTGKKKGTSTVTVKVTLKKAVAGKKSYTLKYKATVKKATTTPVVEEVKTTALSLDKTTATVMAGETVTLTATKTPAESTEAIEWASDKPEIATVSAGVVTGVAEGEAVITAKSGEATATCVVTVTKAIVTPKLTDGKQTKANEIQLTFDIDVKTATSPVNKDDVKVDRADGTMSIPVNAIKFSEDGKSALITLAQALTDATDYKVSYAGTEIQFTASVGAVSAVVINTSSAEQNVNTPISFSLVDAKGIDVTSSVKLTDTVRIDIDGTYTSAETANAAKATITMGNVGDTATVTVTYNSNATGAEDIKASQVITCIDAKAVVGTKLFTYAKPVNGISNCAKFYRGFSDTEVSLAVDQTITSLFFCAKNDDGSVISYDAYAVESSNDDVVSASTTVDTGKFAQITVTGNTVGTANLNVKATKNGKDTFYTIPVKVTKRGELSSITLKADKATMSNAIDNDYFGTLTVTALDTNGNDISKAADVNYDFTIVDGDKYAGADNMIAELAGVGGADGFDVNAGVTKDLSVGPDVVLTKNQAAITADGAKARSYTIKVDVSENDKIISRSTSITVKALADKTWSNYGAWESNTTGAVAGSDLVYSIELGAATIDEGSVATSTTARLYATQGGLFAGYVNADGGVGNVTTGTKTVDDGKASATVDGLTYTAGTVGTDLNDYTIRVKKITEAPAVASTAVVGGVKFTVPTGHEDVLDGYTIAVTTVPTNGGTANDITVNEGNKTIAVEAESDGTTATAAEIMQAFEAEKAGVSTTTNTVEAAVQAITTATATAAGSARIGGFEAAVESLVDINTTTHVITVDYANGDQAELDADIATNGDATLAGFGLTVDGEAAGSATYKTARFAGGLAAAVSQRNTVVAATAKTTIWTPSFGIKYGTGYSVDGNLYDSATNLRYDKDAAKANPGSSVVVNTVNTASATKFYVSGDSTKDGYFAKTGAYTATFFYIQDGKEQEKTNTLTVKNTIYVPTITVTSRTVDSLNGSDIAAVLKASVDMNNNESEHASVADAVYSAVTAAGVATQATETSGKVTAKYAAVVEDGVTFYVPINSTFKAE